MKLNYKIFGAGKPIIILHGLFGMLDNWRSIARRMEDQFQCILVDLRNHGRSPHAGEMNYQIMADDILQLIQDLHLEHINLMGHSMGGKVAMQLALNNPDTIDKLIVVDIAPKKYPPGHRLEMEAIRSVDPGQLSDRNAAEAAFIKVLGNDQTTIQFLLKNLSRKSNGGYEWKANMPVIIENYSKLIDEVHAISPFKKPALFIRGTLSNSIKDEDWPEIVKLFPLARLVSIENAGHWVHADQSEALIASVNAFIES